MTTLVAGLEIQSNAAISSAAVHEPVSSALAMPNRSSRRRQQRSREDAVARGVPSRDRLGDVRELAADPLRAVERDHREIGRLRTPRGDGGDGGHERRDTTGPAALPIEEIRGGAAPRAAPCRERRMPPRAQVDGRALPPRRFRQRRPMCALAAHRGVLTLRTRPAYLTGGVALLTFTRKRQIVHVALVALTVWPLAHIYLVERYDLSSWKLFGWGMYASPRFGYAGMEIYGRRRGTGEFERLTAPTPAIYERATAFLNQYKWLRRLTSSDALVRSVLDAHPEWDQLKIVVSRPHLVPESGMVVMRTEERLQPAD